ncbi:MAG: undecaprenyl-phosphate glucose phosphotransferase [Candidatus Niameybacter stercoravium]|nr:undecaprenyl-phosphate glucose phosphotransferase [Candidatus Niameybacter stercoravium]
MIRENQKYLNRLQVFLDLIIILISFLVAYYIRFYQMDDAIHSLTFEQNLRPILLSIPLYLLFYNIFDIYSTRRTKPLHVELSAIAKTNILCAILIMVGLFIFKIIDYSRKSLMLFFVINTALTISTRLIIRIILKKYRRKGYNLKHCLVIGITDSSALFIDKVQKNKHWGYNIVGIIGSPTNHSKKFKGNPIIGSTAELERILSEKAIDIVIVGVSGSDLTELAHILQVCEKSGVKTQIIPYYHKYIPAKPYMDDLDGLPVIDTRHVPLDNLFKSFLKRSFDIAFSLIAITLTSPILLFAAIMTKCTSPGPIIYKQERVGLNRKNFNMYKFRSMRVQTTEEEKDKWTTQNDPRKTKWGAFMRKTSIDELPQFFNVLKGDMSVVGPRPERPYFVDQFKETIPRYMIKHQVRPGITGWAQVSGYRGDTSIKKRIEHDLYYIENWTFSFDLKIIILTIFKGFVNKNAY